MLKLAVGAQVMLRRNIMCEDGLVNGVRGVIVGYRMSVPTRVTSSCSTCKIS